MHYKLILNGGITMPKILIVEDDRPLSNGILIALRQEGYSFVQSFNIDSAKKQLSENQFDMIILDVNLPDGNGFDLCEEIRKTSSVPIIMLTANDMETDVVTGLELGADDYITKPFSLMVLRARINAQLRRCLQINISKEIVIDDFSYNFDAMEFTKNNVKIELSKTEQKLLRLLVEKKGIILSREELVDRIWTDGAEYVDENALSVTIKRLRDKLEDTPSKPKYIKTVYGLGYTWVVNQNE